MRNKGHAEEDPPVLFRKIEVTRVKVALKKKTNGNLDRMRGGGDRTVLRSISLDQLFCVVAIHSASSLRETTLRAYLSISRYVFSHDEEEEVHAPL